MSNSSFSESALRCLGRLLERMTALEWLYPAAAAINRLGRLTDFQWVDAVAFDAAVQY